MVSSGAPAGKAGNLNSKAWVRTEMERDQEKTQIGSESPVTGGMQD